MNLLKIKPIASKNTSNCIKNFIRREKSSNSVDFLKNEGFIGISKHRVPPAVYGGRHIVTMLPGTGIGPELMTKIIDIFEYALVPVDFEILPDMNSQEDLHNAIVSIKRNGCCLKASLGPFKLSSEDPTHITPDVVLRKTLDLHVCLNIFKPFQNVNARHQEVDVVVIRQNTEGEYAMLEHESRQGIVESMKICTRKNSAKLARWALKFAKNNDRKKLTIVHKANIMKLSDGLFLNTIKKVAAKQYPEIEVNDMIIDNLCMQMVSNPYQFDMLICPNLYGTIITNVMCGLTGGAGLTPGCNFGKNIATFEAASRSQGTLLVGKNIANPIALVNASIAMLEYLGHQKHASLIKRAVKKTIEEDGVKTSDISGTATTDEVITKIKHNICSLMDHCEL